MWSIHSRCFQSSKGNKAIIQNSAREESGAQPWEWWKKSEDGRGEMNGERFREKVRPEFNAENGRKLL